MCKVSDGGPDYKGRKRVSYDMKFLKGNVWYWSISLCIFLMYDAVLFMCSGVPFTFFYAWLSSVQLNVEYIIKPFDLMYECFAYIRS